MAVIDLVKWDGDPGILAWKFPAPAGQELSTWTQLIVNESQDAFLVKQGVYQGPFGAGRHTLTTENIPLLRELIGLPFGGKSPFTAEVWYVNRVTNLDVRWGTPDPIQLQDPKYEVMVPVRAFGQYGIRVVDAKRFLLKLVGTLPAFDTDTLSTYFRGVFTTKIKSGIASAIVKNGKSVLEVNTELELLSDQLKAVLDPEMSEYGLQLAQFNIHSINVPEDDPAVKTLKAALAKRTEMGLLGYSYQQERSFEVLQTAAGNEGNAGTVMGAGLGMGMGMGMGVPIGNAMGQLAPNLQTAAATSACPRCKAANPAGTRFCGGCGNALEAPATAPLSCDKCGTAVPRGAKFCPHCGDAVQACPACGEDNAGDAPQCRSCGEGLPTACGSCARPVPAGARFCPACGARTARTCAKCNAEVARGAKFCSSCGAPQDTENNNAGTAG